MFKQLVIGFLFCAISLNSFGQEKNEVVTKSRYRPGIFWFLTGWKNGKAPKYDRLMFDITYNDWVGDRKTFAMKGPSMGMNVSWLFDIPLAKNGVVSFAIGPNYGLYNLHHNLPVYYDQATKTTSYGENEQAGNFGKIKLVGHQLTVPVEFRFRTKGLQHFKVHIGGKIGYQLSLFNKERHTINGKEEKFKNKDSKDINRLVYSAHVRLGVRNFALYASYNFNPFYSGESSTKLHLLQLGLTVSLF
ncbi:MAG TPA: outer membrane beta-barrel protein [Taishania sp.]|nr:outer membrane beta-barrel protein [Taishania sp.]HNS43153.1 outer membrane beta-barrel protein [Taishania sp.]